MIALQLFVGRTRLGRAMRSTAQDREAAALMGVDINRTIAITFFIGSALAGAAGVVQGLYYGATNFQIGFYAGLKAFTAAVLGGIGNTMGAALGGFIIGFIEVGAAALGYGRWGPADRVRGPRRRPRLPPGRPSRPADRRAGMSAAADVQSAPGARAGAASVRASAASRAGIGRSRSSSGWRSSPPSCRSSSRSRRSTPSRRPSSWVNGFTNAGVFVLLAIGLNIVVGLAGLLDLGYAAFFAIGAYTYAYAASPFTGLQIPFWPMLVIGALVAAIFGILLGAPTLRLRGDYLAIVTLGFGEIVPIVFLNADQFTNGTNGIGGIFQPSPRARSSSPSRTRGRTTS